MAWLRLGDTAATYPALLEVAEHPEADEGSVDEVFGFFMRVAAQSAQHPHATDYIVTMATARLIGGTRARTERLIALAEPSGLMTPVEVDGRRVVQLLNDPDFVHIKTAEVIAWEKQRRADNGNPAVTVLIRMRDGDACRYCGKVVNFNARTGKLAGTYDHRPPGQPASPDTSVVACSSCNSARGDRPLEVADAELPLLPAPRHPYYSRSTRKWLNGYASLLAEHGLTPPPLQDESIADLKPGTPLQRPDTAPDGVRPGSARPADPAPQRVRPADAPTAPDRDLPGPGRTRQDAWVQPTGTPGRDGTGRVGEGLDGEGREAAPPPGGRRRRGRRGGRTTRPRGETR
ncbi:hypothetical protein [Actinotalea sp. JY-7876]|uniref:hypothetical protein n=1 Tax=Actinotalea sp. JY-7876 TaxID=2758442 RepID=UPI0015F40284|nr:hypothetical protein [Actinotalea sp. JY-7876]